MRCLFQIVTSFGYNRKTNQSSSMNPPLPMQTLNSFLSFNFLTFGTPNLFFRTPSPPSYDVTLKVKNPNEKIGIKYGSVADDAELTFWTRTLGFGQFPSLYQNNGDSDFVHVKLDGPEDQSIPPNVQKSMNDKKPEHQISLVLKFNSPLLLNVWIFKMWSRDMDVKCNFRVSMMGEGTKLLKLDCKTNLSA